MLNITRYSARQYVLLVYSIISPLQVRLPDHSLVLQDPERDRDDLSSAGVQREVRRTEDLVHGVCGETGAAFIFSSNDYPPPLTRSAVYGVVTCEEDGAAVQMVTPELRSWIQAVIMEDEVKVII